MIRYSEIGTKGEPVRSRMQDVLRQRVEDRLVYEEADFEKVRDMYGRIYAEMDNPEKYAEAVSEIPGVASVSPCITTGADMEKMKKTSERFDVGEKFAVRVNTSRTDFSSQEVERELGAYVEEFSGSSVDLDNPDTKIEADIRQDTAYMFSKRLQGSSGFPVGTGGRLACLISGGIDSPVAAYQMMTRGVDITPIYFYNKPIAAEDHLLRFRSSVEKLRRFHPGKNWDAYIVDLEEFNEQLMELGKGRMVVHRRMMFRIAERIAESDGLDGLVTGESLSQKSSQTTVNMETTSEAIDKPVHRPLVSWNKNQITRKAREIGTFEDASINSACQSLSPASPSTSTDVRTAEEMEHELDIERLVDQAIEDIKKISL